MLAHRRCSDGCTGSRLRGAGLLACALSFPVIAEEAIPARSGPGTGVILALPGAPPELRRRAAEPFGLTWSPETPPAQLDVGDRSVGASLRCLLLADPGDGEAIPATLRTLHSTRFSAVMDSAEKALGRADVEEADALLASARLRVACGTETLVREDLGRFVLYSAISWILPQGPEPSGAPAADRPEATELLQAAFSVDPDVKLSSEFDAQVRSAAARARAALPDRARRTVRVQLDGLRLAGKQARIDGEALTSSITELPVGTHFLQVIEPDGSSAGGAMVSVTTGTGAAVSVWDPAELIYPTREALSARLEAEVASCALSAGLQSALSAWGRANGYAWILIAGSSSTAEQGHVIRLESTGALPECKTIALAPESAPAPRSRPPRAGVYLTTTLAAATAGAAGYYSYAILRIGVDLLNEDVVRDFGSEYQAHRFAATADRVGWAAVAGLMATLASADVTWRTLRRSGGSGPGGALPMLSLLPGPGIFRLQVRGEW